MKTLCSSSPRLIYTRQLIRHHSTGTSSTIKRHDHGLAYSPPTSASPAKPPSSPLSVMPTNTLLRSLLFTSVMSSRLLDPCLNLMKYLVNTKSPLFSPARNPLVKYAVRASIYRHFCAGTNEAEVKRTVSEMKGVGFAGVILGYGRESVVRLDEEMKGESVASLDEKRQAAYEAAVEEWKDGNLRTLRMVGADDYLGIKFTGAGPAAVEALSRGDPLPPASIQAAMREVCTEIANQGSRLWIDAEQQIFQSTIDQWTINLMREFNRDGRTVVFNTVQGYLKSSAENMNRHLLLSRDEGWNLGIKLVRGAYIAHDIRERIHDTKADTDRNYDNIVEKLLTRQFLFPVQDPERFPDMNLVLASHNAETVRKAYALRRSRIVSGQPTTPVHFAQLHGMADEVSCELLAESRRLNDGVGIEKEAAPKAFKCLCWGGIDECLHFLLRRAVENKGGLERTRHMAKALREEAWRRIWRGQ